MNNKLGVMVAFFNISDAFRTAARPEALSLWPITVLILPTYSGDSDLCFRPS